MAKLDWTKAKEAGGIITTILLAVIVGGWLIAVAGQLGKSVVYDSGGRITLDTFTRSKDVLVLLLPFLTTAVGFWLGSQGTSQMERQADKAAAEADKAHEKTDEAKDATQDATKAMYREAIHAARLTSEVEFWQYRAETAEARLRTLQESQRLPVDPPPQVGTSPRIEGVLDTGDDGF